MGRVCLYYNFTHRVRNLHSFSLYVYRTDSSSSYDKQISPDLAHTVATNRVFRVHGSHNIVSHYHRTTIFVVIAAVNPTTQQGLFPRAMNSLFSCPKGCRIPWLYGTIQYSVVGRCVYYAYTHYTIHTIHTPLLPPEWWRARVKNKEDRRVVGRRTVEILFYNRLRIFWRCPVVVFYARVCVCVADKNDGDDCTRRRRRGRPRNDVRKKKPYMHTYIYYYYKKRISSANNKCIIVCCVTAMGRRCWRAGFVICARSTLSVALSRSVFGGQAGRAVFAGAHV